MAKKKTFETALKELEEIVKEMESGSLSLEETMEKYEAGIKQSRFCMEFLDKIEGKMTLLTRDNHGNLKEEIFEND